MTVATCVDCGSETSDYRSPRCRACYFEDKKYPVLDTPEETEAEIKRRKYINRRNYVYKSRYGITENEYQEMLESQNGKCAICGVHHLELNRRMSVDHDHNCCPGLYSCGDCRRGLLCGKCNLALGGFKDSEAVLRSALTYLSAHRKEEEID
jgi:hypothetical protein